MKNSIVSISARIALAFLFAAQGAAPDAAQLGGDAPAARLEKNVLSATGRQSTLLTVSRFGRYTIRVKSAQGVALQLVDRMAGPGEIAGTAGSSDGRLDLFLDRGVYRVVTLGDTRAKGEARLEVLPFAELHTPKPPLLPELRFVEGTLEDLQQVSHWIQIDEARSYSFEAAGRSLADLRLWKDGTWLVDATPATQIVQPKTGQPVRVCRLATRLERGLYLLTAYGGPPQPWSEGDAHPFFLRSGIRRLGEAGRERMTVSPFGTDRFRVPGTTTFFRIELPAARPLTMDVSTFDADQPFLANEARAEITKESRPPVAELDRESSDSDHVVVVSGEAGQPFVLQHFVRQDLFAMPWSGRGTPVAGGEASWLSTIHSGDPRDSVDATAIVVSAPRGSTTTGSIQPSLTSAIAVGAGTGFARRANVLAPLTLFLDVRDAGQYELWFSGAELRGRIEPLLLSRPQGYASPDPRGSGSMWSLDKGWHVLTIEPVRAGGVATIRVRPTAVSMVTPGQPRGSIRFPEVRLDPRDSHALYLSRQPEVRTGIVLRRLPLDLREPLPLTMAPGDSVAVSFRTSESGTLRAHTEDGTPLELTIDGSKFTGEAPVQATSGSITVAHTGAETSHASLVFIPARMDPRTPLPALPDTALTALPQLPSLTKDAPYYLDLAAGAPGTVLVKADAPGLYRLESTGLLATAGDVRSRTVTSLAHAEEDGVGRNFQIGTYLREGDYQLTVTPRGATAGHLGLTLAPTRLNNGGFLTSRRPARTTLAAGDGIAYRFTITKPGQFRLRSIGLGRTFRYRLEDTAGWPVVTPGVAADITRWFDTGRYRLIILPEATDARVLTLIEPVTGARTFKGHGPHALSLASRVTHLWTEPANDAQPRLLDVWRFELPADAEVQVELTGEMEGTLAREPATVVATLPPGRGFDGVLSAGSYRIETICSRRNHLASYTVAVWPRPLVAGIEREVSAPAEVPVAVGRTGLVEISSFGEQDVKARLLDEAGRVVASSDDRSDDWNFALAATLTAGTYRLRVEPVARTSATTRITMRTPREVEQPPLTLPAGADVNPKRDVQVYPLVLPANGNLLLVSARSAESIGIALEWRASESGPWRGLGTATGHAPRLIVPIRTGAYRLRLWSEDRRDSPIRLSAAAAAAQLGTEDELRAGIALTVVDAVKPLRVAAVTLVRPGVFRIDGETRGLWLCGGGEPHCSEPLLGTIAATGTTLFLASDALDRVRASRVTPAPGAELAVALPYGEAMLVDLAPASGPSLVEVTSPGGQPGVSLTNATARDRMALAPRSAMTIDLAGTARQARVFSASTGDAAQEVRLRTMSFKAAGSERRDFGTHGGSIPVGQSVAFDLPASAKRMRITLSAGTAAALSNGDEVTSILAAGDAPRTEALDTDAQRLTMLARSEDAHFALEISPIALSTARDIAPGKPYEAAQSSAGIVRLTVAGTSAPATLHVRGAADEPILMTTSGRVSRGRDLETDGEAATLLVPHDRSLILAWLSGPSSADTPWGDAETPRPTPAKLPLRQRLTGNTIALALDFKDPALLHLRTTAPVVTSVVREGVAPDIEIHPEGAVLDTPASGRMTLILRSLGTETLSGIAEVSSSPIAPTGEGLGPEVLLAPGSTRAFSFRVLRPGPVGAGVSASAETVSMTLMAPDGRVLGRGPTQMPTLDPGTYIVALHAPSDGAPVTARPALAGLESPPVTPPADVIERYQLGDEAPPAFTSHRVTSVPDEGEMAEEESEEPAEGEEVYEEEDGESEPPPDSVESAEHVIPSVLMTQV